MKIEIDKREESLEASLKSFKSLFNSTMEVMVIHDKGICIDANNVAVKFLKLSLPSIAVVARINSISANTEPSPKMSISHCINWRKRPLCGRSARHTFPI